MTRRLAITGLVLAGFGGLLIYTLTCTSFSTWIFGMGKGDVAFAEQWRARLAPLTDPDAAGTVYPEIEARRFATGEWVMLVSADSHASHRGGTVVVKDSTGEVRAFFGHVCGPGFLWRFRDATALADFYAHEQWQLFGFQEYPNPG